MYFAFESGASPRGLQVRDVVVCAPDPAQPPLLCAAGFTAAAGAVTVLRGPSGVGKTLLLRSIAGLLPGTLRCTGKVRLNGAAQAPRLGRDLVFIPGSAATALNPVISVGTALRRARRRHRLDTSPAQLAAALERVGLEPALLRRYPHELSGGQAQRVLLALGLCAPATCLLLDEPTSALDAASAAGIAGLLRELADEGRTIVLVSHDPQLYLPLADALVTMRDGRIVDEQTMQHAKQVEAGKIESREYSA